MPAIEERFWDYVGTHLKDRIIPGCKYSITEDSITIIHVLDNGKSVSIENLIGQNDTQLITIEIYKHVENGWMPIAMKYISEGNGFMFEQFYNEMMKVAKGE